MTPPRHSLPINEIIVKDRQRELNQAHVDSLATSLSERGLIQPIVINQELRLIAGAHRLAAGKRLNWTHIDVVYKETLSDDDLAELELTEDIKRLDRTWQERCLAIAKIHALKSKNSALVGSKWGQRETAELLNIRSMADINWSLNIAKLLAKGDKEIADATSLSDAWRVVMRREEESILAELAMPVSNGQEGPASEQEGVDAAFDLLLPSEVAENDQSPANGFPAAKDASFFTDDENQDFEDALSRCRLVGYTALSDKEARLLYSRLDNPSESFDAYHARRLEFCSKQEQDRNNIPLSRVLFNCDCIDFMWMPHNSARFDAIITDIPYGIDMDMLNQSNGERGFAQIDTVLTEHTIEGNEELYEKFFIAAYECLKENTYLITWCDQAQWKNMCEEAEFAGFKVQRWPITWVKLHPCMNQTANTNFTKTTEIALVCRKGVATLTSANIPCHILASHDDFKEKMGHPFVKPFDVWKHLIEATTYEGQTILEPFAGHGSGVISCLRLKRRVIGCELNTAHYHALLENVKQEYLSVSPNFTFV